MDKAGKAYWDSLWSGAAIPPPVDPRARNLDNWVNVRLDRFFRELFAREPLPDRTLIEVGCAKSAWLPYFAREHAFRVAGLDYSEVGCEQERSILAAAGVEGTIYCCDVFSPIPEVRRKFSVVVSFGVAEHFDDTGSIIRAFSDLLAPGGLMITLVPNMKGTVGLVQRLLNRPLYDMHVPLSPADLAAAHKDAGLHVVSSRYFLASNFGVNNLNGLDEKALATRAKKFMLRVLYWTSKATWLFERSVSPLPAIPVTAPYVICVARKPARSVA